MDEKVLKRIVKDWGRNNLTLVLLYDYTITLDLYKKLLKLGERDYLSAEQINSILMEKEWIKKVKTQESEDKVYGKHFIKFLFDEIKEKNDG